MLGRSIRRLFVGALLVGFVGGVLPSKTVRVARAAPFVFTSLNDIYYQNFDTLDSASGGSTDTNPWADDSTLAGWYSTRIEYLANRGSNTEGALYSFGAGGGANRALGSVATASTGTIHYGVALTNNTGQSIDYIAVSFYGEQWRNSGNTTQHRLDFSYQLGAPTIANVTAGSWTDVNALDFVGPIASAGSGNLDGDAPANRVLLRMVFPLGSPLASGQQIMLRWSDADDTGNDHGLALDDLAVKLSLAPTAVTWAGSALAVNSTTATAGDTLIYRLTLSDPEGGAFTATDTFAPSVSIISAPGMNVDGQTVQASSTLAPNERRVFTITVQVAAGWTGELNNSATIAGAAGSRMLDAPTVMVAATSPIYLPLIQR